MEFLAETLAWFTSPDQWSGNDAIHARVWEHVRLSLLGTGLAIALALPPALYLAHRRRAEFLATAVVNIGRAVPSFGIVVLAALLFLAWGLPIRFWATTVALVALALPPIFTNTYTAVRSVPPAAVEAARGVGMTEREVLLGVELPMASPVILAGIRIAFVQVIATATLGAIVGPGGGLGRYIVDGFARGRGAHDEVFAGAILVALLTIVAERLFTLGERALLPAGVARLGREVGDDVATAAAA